MIGDIQYNIIMLWVCPKIGMDTKMDQYRTVLWEKNGGVPYLKTNKYLVQSYISPMIPGTHTTMLVARW